MAAAAVRVLVVDDSATARDLICGLIREAPGLAVCGVAYNGRMAVDLARALRPDLVTMDLHMPVMDGLTAITEIMASCATRVLVLSDAADAANAMAAVARGALDATGKPGVDDGATFARRLRLLAAVPLVRPPPPPGIAAPTPAPARPRTPAPPRPAQPANALASGACLVAIAVSTGGPLALARLLPALPAGLPAALLIAQHISDGFAQGMAAWLDGLGPLPVRVPVPGEAVLAGHVYLGDPRWHLTLGADGCVALLPRAEADLYRPSCDRLLTSVAAAGDRAIGVILTGMGRDGPRGIAAIAAAGGATIAQDEGSSVVFGMNREAIESGAVQRVLPIGDIAAALVELAAARAGGATGTGVGTAVGAAAVNGPGARGPRGAG